MRTHFKTIVRKGDHSPWPAFLRSIMGNGFKVGNRISQPSAVSPNISAPPVLADPRLEFSTAQLPVRVYRRAGGAWVQSRFPLQTTTPSLMGFGTTSKRCYIIVWQWLGVRGNHLRWMQRAGRGNIGHATDWLPCMSPLNTQRNSF